MEKRIISNTEIASKVLDALSDRFELTYPDNYQTILAEVDISRKDETGLEDESIIQTIIDSFEAMYEEKGFAADEARRRDQEQLETI
jgi:hypothetical protein